MNGERQLIEGRPVLVVIDIQGGEGAVDEGGPDIPLMPGYDDRLSGAPELIAAARQCDVPIVFSRKPIGGILSTSVVNSTGSKGYISWRVTPAPK